MVESPRLIIPRSSRQSNDIAGQSGTLCFTGEPDAPAREGNAASQGVQEIRLTARDLGKVEETSLP
jgi:hypothetical protein